MSVHLSGESLPSASDPAFRLQRDAIPRTVHHARVPLLGTKLIGTAALALFDLVGSQRPRMDVDAFVIANGRLPGGLCGCASGAVERVSNWFALDIPEHGPPDAPILEFSGLYPNHILEFTRGNRPLRNALLRNVEVEGLLTFPPEILAWLKVWDGRPKDIIGAIIMHAAAVRDENPIATRQEWQEPILHAIHVAETEGCSPAYNHAPAIFHALVANNFNDPAFR